MQWGGILIPGLISMAGIIGGVNNVGVVVCREGVTSLSSKGSFSLDAIAGAVGAVITGGISTTVEDMASVMSESDDKVMGCDCAKPKTWYCNNPVIVIVSHLIRNIY